MAIAALVSAAAAAQGRMTMDTATDTRPAIGHIQRDDPRLDALIAPDAKIEKLAEGITW